MAEMNKKGRCWKGYKPKPGSTAYSEGSCIPEENSVEKAESDDFGSEPIVGNPVRPQGNHLTRIKKKKVNESPDPRSNLGKIQHDQGTAWVKRQNDEDAKKVGGHDNLRKIRSAQLKAKANNTQGQNNNTQGQNNNTQGQNNNTQGQNDKQQAKPENTNGEKKVEEVKVTPTPAERMNNPQARANARGNRAAALRGKLSARIQSRKNYPKGSPLHTGGNSEVDAGRMSNLNKIQ
jgi:hypothetical protein